MTALTTTAATQDTAQPPAVQLFAAEMKRGVTLSGVLERADQEFFELNAEGDTLNADDIAVHETILGGSLGAMVAAQAMYMDFDRDGFVTADEVRRVTTYQSRMRAHGGRFDNDRVVQRELDRVMQLDRDGDGRVSWREAFAPPDIEESHDAGINRPIRRLKLALATDPDNDDEVTLAEFRDVVAALFRAVDANADGVLSDGEAEGRVRRQEQAAQLAVGAACAMPIARPDAEVILIGVREAEALSDVTIGTQDKVVHTASLMVEPGDSPIYVVAVSYSAMIWRVTGATERVEHLVLDSFTSDAGPDGSKVPLVGATGLPADRVTTLERFDCLRFFDEAPSTAAATAARKVRDGAGKEPTKIVGRYELSEVVLPSGKMVTLKEEARRGWPMIHVPGRGTLRIEGDSGDLRITALPDDPGEYVTIYSPGGVIDIDADEVVSSLPAAPYEVLPLEAGLQQLLEEGALTKNRRGEYLIHRKIRYPAGLAGSHGVTFLLLRGVPEPDGNPGHSTVISEETGQPIAGRLR